MTVVIRISFPVMDLGPFSHNLNCVELCLR